MNARTRGLAVVENGMVAPCTAGGRPKGDAIPVEVESLPPEEHERVDRLMAGKYHVDRVLILPIYRLVMKHRGKPIDERSGVDVAIRSTCAASGSAPA